MNKGLDIIDYVRKSALKRIIYLPHAVRQMSRPDRMIGVSDVRKAVKQGELVEDYPEDVRGHSCLILGHGVDGTQIHVVCSPKTDFLAIITAYIPSSQEWEPDLKKRKKL
jgi:hypothetical protein